MDVTPEMRILLVEEERLERWSLGRALEARGYRVDEARSVGEVIAEISRAPPDLVLLDLGREVTAGGLAQLRTCAPGLPVLVLSASGTVASAVAAMREGACDYLPKPCEPGEVLRRVDLALEAGARRVELDRARAEERVRFGVENILGISAEIAEVRAMVRKIARSEATTMLLLGESGVGKGVVARALHYESRVAERPFMNITCTALADTLLESELFGHEKGAFTDAKTRKQGLLELAEGGTVFLDEIGDLPPRLQGKLLGFLEDKSFRRVGGTQDLSVDVRIVAATNRNLERAVRDGDFRSDLYYRLKVIPIYLPSLRERPADIPLLAESFLEHFAAEFGKRVRGFDALAAERVERYAWPGNVRELRNAIERAVVLADGPRLTVRDLPREVVSEPGEPGGEELLTLPPGGMVLEELERSLICQALQRTRGNRTQAARLLGLRRDQIRYRIRKFRLHEVAGGEAD